MDAAHGSSESLSLRNVFITDEIPITSPKVNTFAFPHLKDLNFRGSQVRVQILIGQDNAEALVPLEVRRGAEGEPFAVLTKFGWVLNGPSMMSNHSMKVHAKCNFILTDALNAQNQSDDFSMLRVESQLESWLNIENEGIVQRKAPSVHDKRVLQYWDENIEFVDGHFQVPIPWKANIEVPNNRQMALRRLMSTQKNLVKRDLLVLYDAEINKLIDKGYAEYVPPGPPTGPVWYVPHHPVLNPKKPGKVRIVYDCAAKFQGESLNDKCYSGPDLNNRLLHVLLRFRQYPVAYCADVEAMHYQILIPPNERDALRFLWFDSAGLVQELRMTRHLFGGIWCASSATYALRKSIQNVAQISDTASDIISRSFYVDDCLRSDLNVDAACSGASDALQVLSNSGFHLTKFSSNSLQVLSTIPENDRVSSDKDISPDTEGRVLGVKWNMFHDEFRFEFDVSVEGVMTRRRMLSLTASMFDPLGLISPILLKGKILLQEATALKLPWDDEIPSEIQRDWNLWISNLLSLSDLRIPRCLLITHDVICELHHFSDASEVAFGFCTYLRSVSLSGQINVKLVHSKARVAPLKRQSIPRLELEGAVLAAKADAVLKQEFDIPIEQSYFWCDSQIVLHYVRNESRRFVTFIANRISTIQGLSSPNQWQYIPSADNAADVVSRGCNTLSPTWFSGPSFLHLPQDQWPAHQMTTCCPDDLESKAPTSTAHSASVGRIHPIDQLCSHFSDWHSLKKAVAWILKVKAKISKEVSGPFTTFETGVRHHLQKATCQTPVSKDGRSPH